MKSKFDFASLVDLASNNGTILLTLHPNANQQQRNSLASPPLPIAKVSQAESNALMICAVVSLLANATYKRDGVVRGHTMNAHLCIVFHCAYTAASRRSFHPNNNKNDKRHHSTSHTHLGILHHKLAHLAHFTISNSREWLVRPGVLGGIPVQKAPRGGSQRLGIGTKRRLTAVITQSDCGTDCLWWHRVDDLQHLRDIVVHHLLALLD